MQRFLVIFACLAWSAVAHPVFGEDLLRVGIFQNRPLSFMTGQRTAQGIYPDLLREIAERENWTVRFILDDWSGCLSRLEQGDLDLIVSIARSAEREKVYDFSTVPVITAWGQVFGSENHGISSILDLEGKQIGLVEKDINARHLKELTRKFNITARFTLFPVYKDLCLALTDGRVEAAVMSNISGALFQREYDLHPTPIIFSPVDIYFAAPKGRHPKVLSAIDARLTQWKTDKSSVYYTILSQWHGDLGGYRGISLKWIAGIAGIIGGMAAILFVWNRLLGMEVRRRTRDLALSEKKYRTLSQKALVGICQFTRQGRLVLANQRMAGIFGYDTSREFLGEVPDFRSLFKDPGDFDTLIRDIDSNGGVEGRPMELVARDNRRIWGNLHVRPADEQGAEPIYDGILEDISRRHHREQILTFKLALTQFAADHTLDEVLKKVLDEAEALTQSRMGIFHFLSGDRTVIYDRARSSQTQDLQSLTGSETRAGHPQGIVADCIRQRTSLTANAGESLSPGGASSEDPPRVMAVPVVRDDGVAAVMVIGGKAALYTETDKDILGDLADSAWEIVLKKQTEEEIQLTQKRFLTILNGIESTIYVADMETHEILFMNDYMKQLFDADFTGQICWKAFRHQDGPCDHCSNRFLLDDNGNPTGIHLWQDKHPVTGRWNIYHDRAIKWVDGRMARLQVASDVTRLKEMEAREKEYEDKINQAQKMEALGALASGIAHDFNNILFPILGYAELLKEEVRGNETSERGINEIVTAARRASDLVEQILTFSRQSKQTVAPLKPGIVVKEVIKLMRSSLPSFVQIEKFVAPDCDMIMADPTQFHQIVMNLMTNAFHAMEETEGTMSVRLENVSGKESGLRNQGPHIRLRVEDTGTGMDSQTVEKIFDPYFTTKSKGKGTGLGMSVVHGIVKKYQGEIRIHSTPGQGTRTEVFIPSKARNEQATPSAPGAEPAGGNENILLVDDEDQVLTLEQMVLERLGYRVTVESSSRAAFDRVAADPDRFDLMITDMTMPEMTGDLLAEKIREATPHLPVVICTGFSERLTPERAEDLGIKAVLNKPVTKANLAETVRSVLDGKDLKCANDIAGERHA